MSYAAKEAAHAEDERRTAAVYEVGDTVRMYKPSDSSEGPGWVGGMDKFDGCVGTISSVCDEDSDWRGKSWVRVKFPGHPGLGYLYREAWLQHTVVGKSYTRTPPRDISDCGYDGCSICDPDDQPDERPGDRRDCLQEAHDLVHGDRGKTYGEPWMNHGNVARMVSSWFQRKYGEDFPDLSAADVCIFNLFQKLSREAHSPKRDNLVDICGYAHNIELILEHEAGE